MLPSAPAIPPQITNQPAATNIMAGGSASFTVLAGGTEPLAYQWRRDNNNLAEATNATLSLINVRTNQSGGYAVVITNLAGSKTSMVAQLTVAVPPAPDLPSPGMSGSQFVFSFVPVVGLTNTVQTNAAGSGGNWGALTNIPPPSTATVISITNPINGAARFYRVKFEP
jgi:hypothetical protein